MAIGLPGDNCVDMYANDLGLMAICRDWKIVGYNVLVGGGLGVTPSAAKTFPAVAKRMAFIKPEQVVDVADGDRQSAARFRQSGRPQSGAAEISDRQSGLDRFKAKVEEYYGEPLAPPDPDDVRGFDDHMGWHEQGDGRLVLRPEHRERPHSSTTTNCN